MNSSNIFRYHPSIVKKTGKGLILSKEQNNKVLNYFTSLIESGKTFTNGKLNTVTNIYLDELGQIVFNVSKTDYAHYLYSFDNENTDVPNCVSVACSVILKTTDDYLVFAKMASNTQFPNKIKFIGGAIDDLDIVVDRFNLKNCIDRELKEEIGLSVRELSSTRLKEPIYIITRDELSFFNFLYIIDIDMDRKTLTNKFNKYKLSISDKNQAELSDIIMVKNKFEDLKTLLSNNSYSFISYFAETMDVIFGAKSVGNIIETLSRKDKFSLK